jgi:hypothetical protein
MKPTAARATELRNTFASDPKRLTQMLNAMLIARAQPPRRAGPALTATRR